MKFQDKQNPEVDAWTRARRARQEASSRPETLPADAQTCHSLPSRDAVELFQSPVSLLAGF